MQFRKHLSGILAVVVLATMLLTTTWLPAAASGDESLIPAISPAIRADVGQTVNLGSYMVELADGSTVAGSDLTWYNRQADKTVSKDAPAIPVDVGETLDLSAWSVQLPDGTVVPAAELTWHDPLATWTVQFDDPVIYVNNGETVNFSDWAVQFSAGTSYAAENITWKRTVEGNSVKFAAPVIFATAGQVIDLSSYTVEFTEGNAVFPDLWKSGDTAVSSFTATDTVSTLIATRGTETKNVYVVPANADGEYVLYENDFSTEAKMNELTIGSATSRPQTVRSWSDGSMFLDCKYQDQSWGDEAYCFLPDWLNVFGDFRVEMDIKTAEWFNTSRYIGFLYRTQSNGYSNYYMYYRYDNKAYTCYRGDSKSSFNWSDVHASGTLGTNLTAGAWRTMAIDVDGNTTKAYLDDTPVLTDKTEKKNRVGGIGIINSGFDCYVDNVRVLVKKPAASTTTVTVESFIPTTSGVYAFTAQTADGKSRTVYVLSKDAGDSVYTLSDREFTADSDLEGLVQNEIFSGYTAELSVEDGWMHVPACPSSVYRRVFLVDEDFPEGLNNYTVEVASKYTTYNSSSWWGPMLRVQNEKYPFYIPMMHIGNGTAELDYHTDNSVWESIWVGQGKKSLGEKPLVANKTYVQKAVLSNGRLAYSVNGTVICDFELSALSNMPELNGGKIGIASVGADLYVDYIRVTATKPNVDDTVTTYTAAVTGVKKLIAETADGTQVEVYVVAKQPTEDAYPTFGDGQTVPEAGAFAKPITTFTAEKAGVTVLTAVQSDGTEKQIFVVAKNASETEYVLYETDFSSTVGLSNWSGSLNVVDGNLRLSGQTVTLPSFIGAFGDYRLEAETTIVSQSSSSNWQGFRFRGNAPLLYMRTVTNAWDAVALEVSNKTYQWGYHQAISVGKKYTCTLEVIGDDVTYAIDGKTALKKNRDDAVYDRVGTLGISVSDGMTLDVNRVRVVLLSEKPVPTAPLSVCYDYRAQTAGLATGSIHVTLPADTTADRVTCYWIDADGNHLENFGRFAIGTVDADKTSTIEIVNNTYIPQGAAGIAAYAVNDSGVSATAASCSLPYNAVPLSVGEKLSTFTVLSDTHITTSLSDINSLHWKTALENIAANDPQSAAIFNVGDIVDRGKVVEYANYNTIYNEVKATVSNLPTVYSVFGGHEWFDFSSSGGDTSHEAAMERFYQYTNSSTPYYAMDIQDCHYILFGPDSMPIDQTTVTISDAALSWLRNTLAGYTDGKPIFMFLHQGLPGTVSGAGGVANPAALKAVLKDYPQVILFTAHSHVSLDTLSNMYVADSNMCNVFNTAAVSYQMDEQLTATMTTVHGSEGYFIEVYEDAILVRGRDFLTGEFKPSAQFVVFREGYEYAPVLQPVSVNTVNETFSIDAAGLTPYADGKYTASGAHYYIFGEEATTVNETLESKFHFYYEREGAVYTKRAHAYGDNGDTTDVYGGNSNAAKGNTGWCLLYNHWLQRSTGKTSGEIFRKTDSMVPLNAAGDEISITNFETTYDIRFESEVYGAALLGFRQQTAGKFANGYYNLSKEQGFVAIGRGGITVAAGENIVSSSTDASTDMYNHWQTETFSSALPQQVSVKVRVVQDTCEVWIYNFGTETALHHYEVNIPYVKAGTLSYAVSTVNHCIGNIRLKALTAGGEEADLGVAESSTVGQLNYRNGTIRAIAEKTENGWKYRMLIRPDSGYELRAGSLSVQSVNGVKRLPTRLGFRKTADGTVFEFEADTATKVYAEFYQPTATRPNLSCLGTSVHESGTGLRFVHRLEMDTAAQTITLDGLATPVEDWGVLVALQSVLGEDELTLELAAEKAAVKALSVKARDVYYDYCDSFVDMSIHVSGFDSAPTLKSQKVVSRAYVKLADGTVLYGDAVALSFNDAMAG